MKPSKQMRAAIKDGKEAAEQNDDCPFLPGAGDAGGPDWGNHKVIGRCEMCSEDAHTHLHGMVLCFPCAYSEASWGAPDDKAVQHGV